MASHNQGEKKTDEKKYDRQLRLWGEEGQQRLEDARICLLNATAAGCETLKNLVLPGVGHITIVDGNKVTDVDFNNFFITEGDVGKARATAVADNLLELNSLVKGDHVEKNPVELINSNLSFFKNYTIVIACSVPEEPLLKLAKFLYDNDVALLVVQSVGLISYLRVVRPEHEIVESKPDHPADDLRLANPWPELEKAALSVNFESLDSSQHSHVPYPFILISHLHKWRQEHGGKAPTGSEERKKFQSGILNAARKKGQEENFNEAHRAAFKAYNPASIPSATQQILADSKCVNLDKNSKKFWFLAGALKLFVEKEKVLPLMGSIPDMHSTTDGYIAIQRLYQEKAAADVAQVRANLNGLLTKAGLDTTFIRDEEVKQFCKNANFLTVIRFRSLEQEFTAATTKASLISSELQDPASNVSWYLAYRGALRFQRKNNRFPGENSDQVEQDAQQLNQIMEEYLHEIGIKDSKLDPKYAQEFTRYGASELHTMASFIGGIASQEAIKLLTHQYTPLDNTFIYNGIVSNTSTYNL